jgi:hypothetical protein
VVLILLGVFIFTHSVIFRLTRVSTSTIAGKNALLSSLLTIVRIKLTQTSIFSLIISLIRFNIVFFATTEILLNNLYGSETDTYTLSTIFSIFLVTEFLWFLKVRDKEYLNQLSVYSPHLFLILGYIAISKDSSNLSIVTNSVFGLDNFFRSWEIFNIPFVVIPCLSILILTEKRIINFRKQMYLKTLDGLVDVLTEKIIFLYISIIFIKSLFGGVKDLSFIQVESFLPIIEILILFIKYTLIVFTVSMLLKFKPLNKNEVSSSISIPISFALIINLSIIIYIRGIL